MLLKFNREKTLLLYPILPHVINEEGDFYFPEVFNSYILSDSNSNHNSIECLGEEFTKLLFSLNILSLCYLGIHNAPLRYYKGDNQDVEKTLMYFDANKITKRFNGGIQVQIEDVSLFIQHVFKLIKYNAAFPDLFFTDEKMQFVGSLCQYGHVHLYSMNEEADLLLHRALQETALEIRNKC